MSAYSFRNSRPTNWVEPRQQLDPNRRRLAYGPLQPMLEPAWYERLFFKRG